MSEEKKQKLLKAIEKLKIYENDVELRLKEYEKQKENYKKSNEEIQSEQPEDFENDEIKELRESIETNLIAKQSVDEIIELFREQLNRVDAVLNFQLGVLDLIDFRILVGKIKGNVSKTSEDNFLGLAKETGIRFDFTPKDIDKINKNNQDVILAMVRIDPKNPYRPANISTEEKKKIISDTKFKLKNIRAFYDKTIPFLVKINSYYDKSIDDKFKKILTIRNESVSKRVDEITSNLSELENKISECHEILESVKLANELYEEFKITNDQNTLVKLTIELTDLLLLTPRESKIITYVPAEKKEEKIEEPKQEKPLEKVETNEIINSRVLSSLDYYKDPSTQNIICFLGRDGDDIFTDIVDHFDNSNIPYIQSELISIFNVLYNNADYENKTGGNPKYFSSSKVKAYRDRLGFKYTRFGVSQAQYRIHAITRDSKLLKQLGYGNGRLTFFGALGVNDDNEKTGAYDRMARRGIISLGNNILLQPSFDYIEHISREYVPISLLSDSDKNKIRTGVFNGNIKGTKTKKAIDSFNYINYEVIDSESKNNVKNYLDEYFEKQSNMMFSIINEYNSRKSNSLD